MSIDYGLILHFVDELSEPVSTVTYCLGRVVDPQTGLSVEFPLEVTKENTAHARDFVKRIRDLSTFPLNGWEELTKIKLETTLDLGGRGTYILKEEL